MSGLLSILFSILLIFLVTKWMLNNGDSHPSTKRLSESNELSQSNQTRNRRINPPVNTALVQQVQAVAPILHVEQIKYALRLNHNNVHVVIENYLNGVEFPFPPGFTPSPRPVNLNHANVVNGNDNNTDPRKISNIKQDNLLTKYNVTDDMFSNVIEFDHPMDLLQRKQYMIYKARQDMKQRLSNNDPKWVSLLQ
ncbi:Cue1p PWA37_000695 [Arxiozyma heterogenica]|uniref:CUE domain-containing protein n=1 Tax=Arxiozyma heterogenica TaxID=278026 RepID=A0AAN7WP53_9SACH|nr:hypothetical protein RI543_000582 [Kazachstania heterogenica]